MNFKLNDSFRTNLPADKIIDNYRRQVANACFSYVTPKKASNPKMIHVSDEMLEELNIPLGEKKSEEFLNIFTGNTVVKDTHPYAMCYGGHQFGNWAGQLGDGRAINLFEVKEQGKRWALQLKGAGETPYSRSADGLAVLRSSIREYLCAEAMHHLGIPTTRSLSLALSGDQVLRDVMYNGNPAYEKGAIVCRVAESFIRFGNFEILSARQNTPVLQQLADYTIEYFFPKITSKGKQKYLDFLTEVRNRTIDLIIHWQRVGFVHGVLNTDNMSILGLTIDYGPYGWLDNYDPIFTPNTTDAQHKRYRFENQPHIGMWNIYKLANALYPLVEEVEPLQAILDGFESIYEKKYEKMMCEKLGLTPSDKTLNIIDELEKTLQLTETDFTIFFRNLSDITKVDTSEIALVKISNAFYNPNELDGDILRNWNNWLNNYISVLQNDIISDQERKNKMDSVNPKYIFRNYMAQLAIEDVENGNYDLINEFYQLLKNPYKEQPKFEKWFAKRPECARHKIGCSMLSCSS